VSVRSDNGSRTTQLVETGSDVRDARRLTGADVMTARDVAALLGIPKSTVEDWARRRMIPSRKRGRRRFFLRSEVEQWLRADDIVR
jgi:excisionase family DNA binding protein